MTNFVRNYETEGLQPAGVSPPDIIIDCLQNVNTDSVEIIPTFGNLIYFLNTDVPNDNPSTLNVNFRDTISLHGNTFTLFFKVVTLTASDITINFQISGVQRGSVVLIDGPLKTMFQIHLSSDDILQEEGPPFDARTIQEEIDTIDDEVAQLYSDGGFIFGTPYSPSATSRIADLVLTDQGLAQGVNALTNATGVTLFPPTSPSLLQQIQDLQNDINPLPISQVDFTDGTANGDLDMAGHNVTAGNYATPGAADIGTLLGPIYDAASGPASPYIPQGFYNGFAYYLSNSGFYIYNVSDTWYFSNTLGNTSGNGWASPTLIGVYDGYGVYVGSTQTTQLAFGFSNTGVFTSDNSTFYSDGLGNVTAVNYFGNGSNLAGIVPEAPADSNYYARYNNTWSSFSPGIGDAPADGNIYGRQNNNWVIGPSSLYFYINGGGQGYYGDVNYIRGIGSPNANQIYLGTDMPVFVNNGYQGYTIQGLDFGSGLSISQSSQTDPNTGQSYTIGMLSSTGGGIPEAPNDGNFYARQNSNWSSFTPGIGDAPSDGQTYVRQNANWVVGGAQGPQGPQGDPGPQGPPGAVNSVNNTGAAISMVQNPGSNSTIYIKDLQAGSNISINDNGSYLTINSSGGSSTLDFYKNGSNNGPYSNINLIDNTTGITNANQVYIDQISGCTSGSYNQMIQGVNAGSNISFSYDSIYNSSKGSNDIVATISSTGIPDAPADGTIWARQNNNWVDITTLIVALQNRCTTLEARVDCLVGFNPTCNI